MDTESLQIHSFDTGRALLDRFRPFLEAHEAEHSLLLALLDAPPAEGPHVRLAVTLQDAPVLVCTVRGLHLVLSRGPVAAVELLSREIVGRFAPPGVIGPPPLADAFAETWSALTTTPRSLGMEQRLWRLDRVLQPVDIPGRAREMTAADVETVATWLRAFHAEALPHQPADPAALRRAAEARVGEGRTLLWEADGESVSMASLARPTRHGVTVNAVYTPAERRGNGFATAITAATSAEGLARGKRFTVLYTDLANPVSNAIYPRVGYRPVADSRLWLFRRAVS